MSFFNEQFLPIIQKYVEQIKKSGKQDFYTVDIIKAYLGRYYVDETSPNESINANIGKFLKENASVLEIQEIASEQPVKDDDGKHSKSSIWKFI